MIAVKIQIEPYLAEYLYGKYSNKDTASPIHFTDDSDLYHFIYDLMKVRPINCPPIERGNLSFYLPCRYAGKNPETHNYFSIRAVKILQKRFYNAFCADLFDFINEKYYRQGVNYLNAAHLFAIQYNITTIEDESIRKKYYRWRDIQRKKNRKKINEQV